MIKLKKVQITCPNCKCELQYNKKAFYEENIKILQKYGKKRGLK